jgi:hypothetical protein
MTGQSVRTLRRHIAAGRLPVVRAKGKVFITPAGARAWLGHDPTVWNLQPSTTATWRFAPVRLYATLAKLTPREVRHLIDKGAVQTLRLGGRVFVSGEEIDQLLARMSDTGNR